MNKANLKSYAPKARLDFIKAVTERANVLGISAAGVVPAEVRGDVVLIEGREWPAKVAGQRDELIGRIKRHGFEQTMDEVAYTWFNRFAALRYMEIHDYLGHGWRVLSSRDGGLPEILRHASEVTLPGLNPDRAREMQLAGNQDNELYKLLLVAQCNELSRVMPFLFERIDDETELLLPENLLRTDSIVAKLVEQVPEEDWQEIEVIGWLYQFYISERKEQVIGNVVKSEDIPAATQLFTPNWIVQYLVQNSVGRLWLMANPTSALATQWPYYIRPAEQTPEVRSQLDALIQTRIREDGETLNPETITVLDPACGSGHILVVAYEVLKSIYLERGYQPRSIPRLILEKNLFGLDIDDRAVQLTGFALLMKARSDDRRIFSEPPALNVFGLKDGNGMNFEDLATALAPHGVERPSLKVLLEAFASAKTFGSLISLPAALEGSSLQRMWTALHSAIQEGDLYARQAAEDLKPIVSQAIVLANNFDVLVANPPYIGSKYLNTQLRNLAKSQFPKSKSDLYSMAVERFARYVKSTGICGFMTPFTWMFLSSFEDFREIIHGENTLLSLIQPQYHTFFESAAVPICAFLIQGASTRDYQATFIKLTEFRGAELQAPKALEAISDRGCPWRFEAKPDDFSLIPGKPIAYWIPTRTIRSFAEMKSVGSVAEAKQGLITGDNGRFLRLWHEVSRGNIRFDSKGRSDAKASQVKWFPFQKGGEFRKWFGNHFYVVNWQDDGEEIRSFVDENGKLRSRPQSLDYYFRPGVSWTSVTISTFNCRHSPEGFIYSEPGPILYAESNEERMFLCALLNSKAADFLLQLIAPAMHFNQGHVSCVPRPDFDPETRAKIVMASERLISLSKTDWDSREISWDFCESPLLADKPPKTLSLEGAFLRFVERQTAVLANFAELECELNSIFIRALDLGDLLSAPVPRKALSLSTCLEYRFDVDQAAEEHKVRFRAEISAELVSYIVGCVMGRYSISEPGLIYAGGGNLGFDQNRYDRRFPADTDGILPLTDEQWFEDDAASRVRNFLGVVWGKEQVEKNLAWLAESLGKKGGDTADETVRLYLADRFYKDHLQAYKKRPIYWLFSSGKQGAFQALVYLHRYNEGTLARMRAEYVVPLISKIASRLDMLDKDIAAASSAAARTKLQKQIESLRKKQIELLAYDEKLRHYADMRIALDLDDGVKVNYAKFGDLVAESKAITGGSDE